MAQVFSFLLGLRHVAVLLITVTVGAKMATLRKYGDTYQKLYPTSAQVIVQADPLRYWKFGSGRVSSLYLIG